MKIPQLFSSGKKDDVDGSIRDEAAAYVLYALATHQREEENNPAEALALYNRALILQREALGEDHVLVARTLHSIGLCLTALEQSFEAMTALQEALWIRQTQLGPGDPAVAETTTALWKLLSNERRRIEDGNGNDDGKHDSIKDDTVGRSDACGSSSDKAVTGKDGHTPTKKTYTPATAARNAAGSQSQTRTKPNSASARSA